MNISTNEDDDDAPDAGRCPHCRTWLKDLAEDVDDQNATDDVTKDVAAAKCPKCGESIAIVREHSFAVRRLKARV